jgi:hypothetical protein
MYSVRLQTKTHAVDEIDSNAARILEGGFVFDASSVHCYQSMRRRDLASRFWTPSAAGIDSTRNLNPLLLPAPLRVPLPVPPASVSMLHRTQHDGMLASTLIITGSGVTALPCQTREENARQPHNWSSPPQPHGSQHCCYWQRRAPRLRDRVEKFRDIKILLEVLLCSRCKQKPS